MVSKKVTVKNPTGLHLRPAGILCNEAMKYQSRWGHGKCKECTECTWCMRKMRK